MSEEPTEALPGRTLPLRRTLSSAAILRRTQAGWVSVVFIGAALLLAVVAISVSIGSVHIGLSETVSILLGHLHLGAFGGDYVQGSAADRIIWDVRLPRVLTAVLVGGTLASSGVSYQAVFRNQLADPYLIGVAAGAGLGATLAIVSPLPLDYYHFGYVALFAFAGAVIAVAVTYELARVGLAVPPATHVLAGIAVSSAASAATSLLMVLHEEKINIIFSWLYGDFTSSSWPKLWAVAPYVGASWLVLLGLSFRLNVLQLSDDEARSLGVRVELLKLVVIVTASLATAVCVAVAGLIGFVGLLVPHACRLVVGPDHRILLPVTILVGGAFLALADLGARTVLSPQEIPVGIVTAFVGAPFFLILLRRNRKAMLGV